MKNYIEKIFYPLINRSFGSKKLAASFCLGTYLAFSPFLGLQTWLVFPFCWIFGLSVTIAIAALYLINNPFTLVPIMVADYFFGKWLVNDIFQIDLINKNPLWLDSFLKFLAKYIINIEKYLGAKFCFWCFMIGGNIIALAVSIMLYPIMNKFFSNLIIKAKTYEDNSSK